MPAKVWVYPERKFEELGAIRYRASWEEVRPEAEGKDDIDPDSDILHCFANYRTKKAALKKARRIVDAGRTAFGAVTVVRQVVDWFVEEDRIAEWANTSEEQEICSGRPFRRVRSGVVSAV